MENTFSDDEFREFHRIVQQAALVAYPNPERVGCPGTTVLREVANTTLPFEHSAYVHIAKCSPCLGEMLSFRSESRERRKIRKMWVSAVVGAVAALILLTLGVYFTRLRMQPDGVHQIASDHQLERPVNTIFLTANLLRGERASQPNALTMPTAPSNLRLLLNLENDTYPRYSVVLQTEGGQVLSNVNGLSSVPVQAGRAVSLNVSSELFQPGNYIVMLRGERPNTETQIVNLYELVVK